MSLLEATWRTAARHARAAGLRALAAGLAAMLLAPGSGTPARADDDAIEVLSSTAVSEFPEGIRFSLEATGHIDEVVVRFAAKGQRASQYDYLDVVDNETSAGPGSRAELLYRTNTPARYIPPGTVLRYYFELTGGEGETVETDPQELVLLDSRFEWDTVTEGPVTVFYHGPVTTRARSMLDTSLQTIAAMGPMLGVADDDRPINITMYNNSAEMFDATLPRSGAIARELVTEGLAFSDRSAVIVNGNSRRATGTMSHELTHVLIGRAVSGARSALPIWLNEGLAEYANVDPGVSYQRYLEWAIDTGRLLPLTSLDTFPGDPDLTIVAYGHAQSVIAFLIREFGPEAMGAFLAEFNTSRRLDDAMEAVFGFDRKGLDAAWREAVGADPYVEATAAPLPTARPLPALVPYSLTPMPAPSPDEAAIPTPTPAPAPAATTEQPSGGGAAGGGCSAPAGAAPPVEAASAALLLAVAAGAYRTARGGGRGR